MICTKKDAVHTLPQLILYFQFITTANTGARAGGGFSGGWTYLHGSPLYANSFYVLLKKGPRGTKRELKMNAACHHKAVGR